MGGNDNSLAPKVLVGRCRRIKPAFFSFSARHYLTYATFNLKLSIFNNTAEESW